MKTNAYIAGAIAAIALAGCEAATGGDGRTMSGAPVVGQLKANFNTQMNDISIVSPAGWSCSGSFKRSTDLFVKTATITVPLTCNNGAKGSGIVAANQYENSATMAFQLSNGEQGSVKFGNG